MNKGDRVWFLEIYGPPRLTLVGDEYTYTYRKHRVYGTIVDVLTGDGFPPSVTIKVDGAGQYSGLRGMPVKKVTRVKSVASQEKRQSCCRWG